MAQISVESQNNQRSPINRDSFRTSPSSSQHPALPDHPKIKVSKFDKFFRLIPNAGIRSGSSSARKSEGVQSAMQRVQQIQQQQARDEQVGKFAGFRKTKSTDEIASRQPDTESDDSSQTSPTNVKTNSPEFGATVKQISPQSWHQKMNSEPVPMVENSDQANNVASQHEVVKPVPKRAFSTATPPVFQSLDNSSYPRRKISAPAPMRKVSRELILATSGSSLETSSNSTPQSNQSPDVPVRLRQTPGRTHFRARPQSLIEKPTFNVNTSTIDDDSIVRTNSLMPTSYAKAKASAVRRPLKGSPIAENEPSKANTLPHSKVATNTKLLHAIQRHKNRNSTEPDFRTASLDELQINRKIQDRGPNQQVSSVKVVYDHVTKQYYSPADAYKNGVIDMNTFSRCSAKRRFLFPKTNSSNSMNSLGSCDSIPESQSSTVRKICIHDQRSNEIIGLDQAFSRGILDQTRYNTLKNQEMDESFSTGRRSVSANALNHISNLSTSSLPRPRLNSFVGGGSNSPQKNSQAKERNFVPKFHVKRNANSGNTNSSPVQRNGGLWNGSGRTYSFNSVVSNESVGSNENFQDRRFTKSSRANASLNFKSAEPQESKDDHTFEQLEEQREQTVNKNTTVVIPSRVRVHLDTPNGKIQIELKEALDRKLITEREYDKVIEALQNEKS